MTTAKPAFELEIERLVDAPIARVWKAWTDPEQLKRWFAPRPYQLIVKSMDFRVGGRYEMAMRGPDGLDFPFGGTYREIVPPKDNMTTVITFAETGGKTRVHARQTFLAMTPVVKHAAAGAEQGWNMTMDQLVEFAQKG
jgi:uncharacterized protein YndB with AHSA1/START domain